MAEVKVETIALDGVGKPTDQHSKRSTTALAGPAEVEEAIVQASAIAQRSLDQVPECPGRRVSTMDITFGLTLATEADVLLSKASAEASFEVTLTVDRVSDQP
ncbi:CU044_2847 family protein [Streptomyces chartreusis]